MKAIAYHRFGSLDVLQIDDLPAPGCPPDGILVRVKAASVNVIDSRTRRGEMSPLVNKKFPKIAGLDFAGTVTAVGPQATQFKVGDSVFGATPSLQSAAMAETVAVRETAVAAKPDALTFEEAAAAPVCSLAALYSLRELGRLRPGQNVLIYGSSGGAGLAAIQLAKEIGAAITTVCGTAGLALCQELGAHRTIDYKKGSVTLTGKFDVIVDFSGRFPFSTARNYLTPAGRFVDPSPTIPKFIGSKLANLIRPQQNLMLQTESATQDLNYLARLSDQGKFRVPIARAFPFPDFRQAFAAQESGGVIGKIVILGPS